MKFKFLRSGNENVEYYFQNNKQGSNLQSDLKM